jgi:hypothetical protein
MNTFRSYPSVKYILLIVFFMLSSCYEYLYSANIELQLKSYIEKVSDDDFIPTVIVLKKVDNPYIDSIVLAETLPKKERRSKVLLHSRNQADYIFAKISPLLSGHEKRGNLKIERIFYVHPSFSLLVKKSALLEILASKFTESAILNNERYMLLKDTDFSPDYTRFSDDCSPFSSFSPMSEMDIAWGVSQINAPSVWAEGFTGAGVSVGVFDTGVRYTHLDLVSRMWTNTGEIPLMALMMTAMDI